MTATESDVPIIGTLLSHAHKYAELGFAVFPVNPQTKAPHVSQYEATTDLEIIDRWWQSWPDALIGHRISPLEIILDVDPRHGGLETWRALKNEMPTFQTRVHYSGRGDGGGHIWFQRPAEKLTITKLDQWSKDRGVGHQTDGARWTCGIDLLRNEHRYTILPPSPHPESKQPYVWSEGQSPTAQIAALPALLCELLIPDEPETLDTAPRQPKQSDSIADWYSENNSWSTLLARHGWTLVGGNGDADRSRWRHPRATAPYSATIRYGCLFVYSSNTPFEQTAPGDVHGYTRFAAFALLDHNGDQKQAAREARFQKGPDEQRSATSGRQLADNPPDDLALLPGTTLKPGTQEITPREQRSLDAYARLSGKLRSTNDILQMPEPTWLIDGILVRDSLAVLWGAPASAKSFLAIDWALSIASGSWWFNRKVEKGGALYIAAEGTGGLSKRVKAWSVDRKVSGLEAAMWLPQSVNFLDVAQSEAIERITDELQPVFIVIDTLARSMVGGDENAVQDMSRVIDRCEAIQKSTKATVLLVHHSTKEESTMRGSSALLGAIDTEIHCKKDETRVTIEAGKQKDGEPFSKLQLHLVKTESSCVLKVMHSPEALIGESPRTKEHLERLRSLFIRTLDETGMPGGKFRIAITEELGIGETRAFQLQSDLLKEGFIRNVGTTSRAHFVLVENHSGAPPGDSFTHSQTIHSDIHSTGSSSFTSGYKNPEGVFSPERAENVNQPKTHGASKTINADDLI